MIEFYKSAGDKLQALPEYEEGCWINMVAPRSDELIFCEEVLGVPKDFLNAALDLEERSRIESEDGVTLIVVDVPVVEMDVKSYMYSTIPFAIIHTHECLITMCLEELPLVSDFTDGRVRNVSTDKHTRMIFQMLYRNSTRFLMYLRQIDKASDRTHTELQKSYRNKELLQMMSLEKSLVYFSTSLKGNEVVLEKLVKVNYIKKFPEDTDLLEDVIVENRQAIEMCSIYRDILSGTMDAYASLISNNLNIVMKFMAAVTIVLAIPTLVTSAWGANVTVPWENNPMGFWYMLGLALLGTIVAVIFLWRRKMF
ncbi:MAG: magnesium transporter CorA family protein [Eubacteriales bacterium]|nr:magnesium transporter CorA family protein [Eubacteriales bacterium]